MKKILSASLIAAMAVCTANAGLTQRGAQISDVVRMMEENPEYINTAADAIVTARAAKTVGKRFNGTAGNLNTSKLNTQKLSVKGGTNTNNNPEAEQNSHTDDLTGALILDSVEDIYLLLGNNMFNHEICNYQTYTSAVTALVEANYTAEQLGKAISDLNDDRNRICNF